MLKFLKVLFLIPTLLLTGYTVPHPIHISVTQIDHRVEQKSLQITVKVFSDDLENTLKTRNQVEKLPEKTDELLYSYLKETLKIKADGKDIDYQWVGFETEADAHFIFVEATGVKKIKRLQISNSILFELFDDQSNILHYEKGDLRKSELFQVGDGMKVIEI